jgi:[ribosomal protein S18]-alanine N-acetyltransferase
VGSRIWDAFGSKGSPVEVRPARRDDLRFLKKIEDRVFEAGYPEPVFRQLLDLFPSLFFVAPAEGEVLGYVVGGLSFPHGDAWLLSLAVGPEGRGRGLAKALVDALVAAAGEIPARYLKLTVDPGAREALDFYGRLGFVAGPREEAYLGAGYPRVVMARRL